MATTIGDEDDLNALLEHLIALDHDAIEAYEAAIERIDNATHKRSLEEFCKDHVDHTRTLGELLRAQGGTPPDGPNAKAMLTKGKVVMADLMGDEAILKAMLSNEGDTNTAYERATANTVANPEVRAVLQENFADEQKHRTWLEHAIAQEDEDASRPEPDASSPNAL